MYSSRRTLPCESCGARIQPRDKVFVYFYNKKSSAVSMAGISISYARKEKRLCRDCHEREQEGVRHGSV
jgi:hypothetical protein